MVEGNFTSRRIPTDQRATAEEVAIAFNALTDEEQAALDRYARWRIIRIGLGAAGRTHEDLLQEVFEAIFDTQRRGWKKEVNFYSFVKGVIRSTSSNWAAKNKRQRLRLTVGTTIRDECSAELWADTQAASFDDYHISVIAEDIKSKLEERVADHPVRREVLAGWKTGMNGLEIQRRSGITKSQYDAARQWIYRERKKLAAEVQRHE
jgi:DNA-directed RNA polymerase specialized sigma24 family protein